MKSFVQRLLAVAPLALVAACNPSLFDWKPPPCDYVSQCLSSTQGMKLPASCKYLTDDAERARCVTSVEQRLQDDGPTRQKNVIRQVDAYQKAMLEYRLLNYRLQNAREPPELDGGITPEQYKAIALPFPWMQSSAAPSAVPPMPSAKR